jgi:hypothetical protein
MRKLSIGLRPVSVATIFALTLVFLLSGAQGTKAVVVPPTFVSALLTALPGVETLVSKIFASKQPTKDQAAAIKTATTDSNNGKAQLKKYAVREEIIWRVVSASDEASSNAATMSQILGTKSQLSDSEVALLSDALGHVKGGVDNVVNSKPDLTALDGEELTRMTNLIQGGPTLVSNLEKALNKYSAKQPDPTLVDLIRKNLDQLSTIFRQLNESTVTEIQMIAQGLAAASAPAPPAPTDKTGIKTATDKVAAEAFGQLSFLDRPIEKYMGAVAYGYGELANPKKE